MKPSASKVAISGAAAHDLASDENGRHIEFNRILSESVVGAREEAAAVDDSDSDDLF